MNPADALRELRSVRFVAHTLLWGFALGPLIAYAVTRIIPLEPPYATGLLLPGMTPCAPFLPAIVSKTEEDLGFTAAFMILASACAVVFMPFAVPVMVDGLTVSASAIARSLLAIVLLPMVIATVILRAVPTTTVMSATDPGQESPWRRKATL